MNGLFEQLQKVDISLPLQMLPSMPFIDTGGTNGWLGDADWLSTFANTLNLPGHISRVVCRKLPAWQGIPPHIDPGGPYDRRYHIPLVTHQDVKMRWPEDGIEAHLEAGFLYEVCFSKLHEIVHKAPIDRVHIQINTVHYMEQV